MSSSGPAEGGRRPWSGRRLHFVGVGGAGMSGYARAAHALGATVTGSDSALSPYAERLRADSVLDVRVGHDAANVPAGGDDVEVIYSSAVPVDNPERAAACARGLRVRPRAELLGELTAMKRTIAVAGTHGKTTTASMIVHALRAAGLRPGWLIGAPIGGGLANAEWGEGEWLVVEADESDRSMLSLYFEVGVLTNVELDHHATFSSLAELRDTFRAFLARATAAVVVWDRPELLELAPSPVATGVEEREPGKGIEVVPFALAEPRSGEDGESRITGGESRIMGGESQIAGRTEILQRFSWRGQEVALKVPGAHNALNATAALEVARLAGADADRAIGGLAAFTGAARRFQLLGETASGAVVYDDYAHHPTEVAATLTAARTLEPGRLVAVFQPHLYSRTALLAREFGVALALADVVVVLDVYPARERAVDHPGVSGLLIAEAATDAAHGKPVYWLPGFAEAETILKGVLGEGDICLVMGAGDIDTLGRGLLGEQRDV
jgi:UDP-N-acetylmuramate--alanine ligase